MTAPFLVLMLLLMLAATLISGDAVVGLLAGATFALVLLTSVSHP